ncbi:MAG TPA: glucosyl-3-phosphoglycerate synthase [Actinomycetota bacterium]|nr:glucosyl-3-phosphoglycerate synthase [Actinomycetota bacterium]
MDDPVLPPDLAAWFARRTFTGSPSPAETAAAKVAAGLTVSVCLPALDEEATVGAICSTIARELVDGCGLVDELIVVDSGSTDRTAAEACAAGARVVAAGDVLRGAAPVVPRGKGETLWKSLAVAQGDLVVWLDSDTRGFGSHFVTNLVAPLLADESIALCKGFYRRPLATGGGHAGEGGGRVTELAARPLLALLFPELGGVVQPLSGEYAGRAEVLRSLPMFTGYSVEVGILVDVVERFGLDALAQADLGVRVHRNRDVASLGRMAAEIMEAILTRAEDLGRLKTVDYLGDLLVQFDQRATPRPVPARIQLGERPPLNEVLKP